MYVSNVERSSDGQAKLLGVSDEDEWERIKEVMRELAEVDSSYQPPKFDVLLAAYNFIDNNSIPMLYLLW